jgi:hypothetical protein
MNLSNIFKAQSVVLIINGIGGLFLTTAFFGSAGWEITPDLITLGQFVGMTFLVIAVWSWRIPDVVGDSLKSMGMLFAIGGLLWTLIIGYHILMGAVAGPTAYVNIILTAVFAIGFYFYSRD